MEIGQRLKQARLEAGLSQRQLCGETITRNMLSQIENGTARPSMDTLRDLAGRLGKPMSYFLDEQAVLSPNQTCIARARECTPAQALEELKHYQAPDALFDRERYLLEALACLDLAQEAIGDNRNGYAAALLQQAETAGAQTPYYTPELEHRRLLLCGQTKHHTAQELVKKLPLLDAELQLRAQAALDAGEPARCRDLLHASEDRDTQWEYLIAESYFQQADYASAAAHYRRAETEWPERVCARLEHCFRELGDYRLAYEYACKQRTL